MPDPRYFSIPSTVVGAVALRNEALNWTPWVRSLIQLPLAWANSPAEINAAWPRTVIRSRCPRALTRRTRKPFSALWKVTRATRPANDHAQSLATHSRIAFSQLHRFEPSWLASLQAAAGNAMRTRA